MNSRHKINRSSPISTLLHHFTLSERGLYSALKAMPDCNIKSPSNLSRLLKDESMLDMRDVGRIGQHFGTLLGIEDEVASQALLAEHWIWRKEREGLIVPDDSFDIRSPVVRHKEFRSAVRTILYEHPYLVTISAANEKQVGRRRLAQSIVQYCAYDAPPEVRRTVKTVSLAHLDSDKQITRPVDIERVAGFISVQLGLAQRNGDDREQNFVDRVVESIADSFRYLLRPLFLIKDTRGVPDAILGEFADRLLSKLPQDSQLIMMITSERSLLKHENEVNFHLDYLTPEETASYIVWKSGVDPAQLPELVRFCHGMRREVRKPSVASLLAGAYLLREFRDESPWCSFTVGTTDTIVSGRQENIAVVLRQVIEAAGHGSSIESVLSANDVFAATMRYGGINGRAVLGYYARILLFALAIFDGRFSKRAAYACFFDTGKPLLTGKRLRKFEPLLNRLCLSGAVICEQLFDPAYFSLEVDIKTWIRNWRNGSVIPYKGIERIAKYRYLTYIGNEICAALNQYKLDPHAIDTASWSTFARLEPEARHIDLFLTEIWSHIEGGEHSLPVPEMEDAELPGLEVWERQLVWLSRLCANLALFWEAANLAGTGIFHLNKAIQLLEATIIALEERKDLSANVERQLCAIRAQLRLSLLCIEVRQRRSGFKPQEWNDLLKKAEADVEVSGYQYGQALLQLLEGMILNRKKCIEGLKELEQAAKLGQECARENNKVNKVSPHQASRQEGTKPGIEEVSPSQQLWMAQDRHPIARYLTFTVQREIGRAQLRKGDIVASLATGRSLLRVAQMTRESRLIAEALIALTHSSWFLAVEETNRPFTETTLSHIRQYLFQMDAFIADLPVDKTTLRSHYLTMLGIYHLEKGLASLVSEFNETDHIENRRAYGEELFTTGISQVTDTHFRSLYFAFVADAYLRFSLVTNDASILYGDKQQSSSKREEKQQGRAKPSALAAFYVIRSTRDRLYETDKGYDLSQVLRKLYSRLYRQIRTEELDAAITLHCAVDDSRSTDENKLLEKHLREFSKMYSQPTSPE